MSGDPSALLLQYVREQDAKGFKQLVKTLGKKQGIEAANELVYIKKAHFSDEERKFFKRMFAEINAEGGVGASRRKTRKPKKSKRASRRVKY